MKKYYRLFIKNKINYKYILKMLCSNLNKNDVEEPMKKGKYYFGEMINEKMEFLVLLTEDDVKDKTWFWKSSVKDSLLKNKKKIPGDLHILNFDDINKPEIMKDFIIDGSPLPREVYIKLPNKNIYITSEKYALKYLSLRENELKNIFIALGAKSIKWAVKRSNNNNNTIEVGGGANFGNVNISETVKIENNESKFNSELNEMTFDFNENINNIDQKLFIDKNYYFLPKEYEWQDIIIRRLENNLIGDKYNFKYNDSIKFKSSLTTKLKLIEINFNYNTEDVNNLEIEYEIEYYKITPPVVEEVINKENVI